MPLPMIHLSVAVNIERNLGLENSPLFFLGSISPDAIHMRIDSSSKDKSKTHYKGETKDESLENVRIMLKCAKALEEEDLKIFILGYCTHILTDLVWLDTVYKNYRTTLAQSKLELEHRALYYKETDYIDFKLYREAPWRERIWNELSISKAIDFHDILTSEEIENWKIRTLTWFDDDEKDPKIPPEFIKEDMIDEFVIEATEYINKEITLYWV